MATSNMARTLYERSMTYLGGQNVWRKSKGKIGRSPVVAGGVPTNPFANGGVFYAANLAYFVPSTKALTVLKVFKLVKAGAAADTVLELDGTGYSHVPSVGDVIMKAPTTGTATGQSGKIVNVQFDGEKFTVTLDTALGTLTTTDLLVEAIGTAAASAAKVLVPTINTFVETDWVQELPANGGYGYSNISMSMTVIEHEEAKIAKMGDLPAYIKSQNKSAFPDTYFQL